MTEIVTVTRTPAAWTASIGGRTYTGGTEAEALEALRSAGWALGGDAGDPLDARAMGDGYQYSQYASRGEAFDAPPAPAVRDLNWTPDQYGLLFGADDLVGVPEIAERAEVKVPTVHSWRARHADFPTPIRTLGMGPVWSWTQVERWVARRRGPGRPTGR